MLAICIENLPSPEPYPGLLAVCAVEIAKSSLVPALFMNIHAYLTVQISRKGDRLRFNLHKYKSKNM